MFPSIWTTINKNTHTHKIGNLCCLCFVLFVLSPFPSFSRYFDSIRDSFLISSHLFYSIYYWSCKRCDSLHCIVHKLIVFFPIFFSSSSSNFKCVQFLLFICVRFILCWSICAYRVFCRSFESSQMSATAIVSECIRFWCAYWMRAFTQLHFDVATSSGFSVFPSSNW